MQCSATADKEEERSQSMLRKTVRSVAWGIGLGIVLSFIGASDVIAQQPIRPVPLTPFADGQDSVLVADLRYQIGTTNFVVVVPAGFVTDFASTPRAIWAVLPPVGPYQLAAVVHDFLYWDQGCTRQQADDLLRVAMSESKVKPLERDLIWQAVRKFGETAWAGNAAAKAAGKPRIIPPGEMNIPALVTWPEYQAQLIAKGVTPQPPPAAPPSYCGAAGMVDLR
jgi:Protein of unknown function (DUF1353)